MRPGTCSHLYGQQQGVHQPVPLEQASHGGREGTVRQFVDQSLDRRAIRVTDGRLKERSELTEGRLVQGVDFTHVLCGVEAHCRSLCNHAECFPGLLDGVGAVGNAGQAGKNKAIFNINQRILIYASDENVTKKCCFS